MQQIIEKLRHILAAGQGSLTLQRRLFVFFLLFLVAIMSGILSIMLFTGVFSAGEKENRIFLENELNHFSTSLTKETGKLAVEALSLSSRLSVQIEHSLRPDNSLIDLQDRAGIITDLLQQATPLLLTSLEKSNCSGVFIIMDATINPNLPQAELSKAGIFLKNMEPNVLHKVSPTIRMQRGPSSIAQLNNLDLLPQWQMEFTVQEGDFFYKTLHAAMQNNELSRSYYWHHGDKLAGNYENCVFLCVPLVLSDDTIIGICGFEISAMLFKLQYLPDNTTYNRVFALWSPLEEQKLDTAHALFAGNHISNSTEILLPNNKDDGLISYIDPILNQVQYYGLQQEITLYPRNAYHANESWAAAILMPEVDYLNHLNASNQYILLLLFLLMACSTAAALWISKHYINPVVTALDFVRNGSKDRAKTNITEIDDLFSYLAERDLEEETKQAQDSVADPLSVNVSATVATNLNDASLSRPETATKSSALYDEFMRNISTLSPAERAVFNLYTEGYDAKRITEILCLSINTIKTHNRRIYQKLGVSSRKELLVYVKMMHERQDELP